MFGGLESRDFGQADDAVFGGNVGGLERGRDQSVRRRDVDDATITALLHGWQHGLAGVEHGRQVHRDDGIPAIFGKRLERGDMLDAGVVDQNVDRASAFDHCGDRGGLAQVRGVVHDGHAVAGKVVLQLAGMLRRGNAVERDRGALGSEFSGNGQSDAAGRSSDEGGAAGEGAFVRHAGVMVWDRCRGNRPLLS